MSLAALTLSALAVLLPVQPQDETPAWQAVPPVGGDVEELDGIPVLRLHGTVQERGFAEGYHFAAEILACFDEFALGHVAQDRPRIWDLVLRPVIEQRFDFPDETRTWAKAVVAGMRAKNGGDLKLARVDRDFDARDVLACAAIPDIAGVLCSSVAAYGPATEGGGVIVARNLDYPSTPAIRSSCIVRVHAPMGERPGWVGIGWPGSPGCLTGLSDRGVFVAIHDVDDVPAVPDVTFTPRVLALQELIETVSPSATTAEDAAALLRRHRFMMGGNAMLAWDAGGDGPAVQGAAVLEIGTTAERDGGITLRLPAKDQSFLACSNHHRARSDEGHGCGRYGGLIRGAASDPLNVERAWELIDESGMSITLYRCVAEPGKRTIEVQRKSDDGWAAVETIHATAVLDKTR